MTLPTTTYVNGVSPNPPSSEDPLSPKSSPPPPLPPPLPTPPPPREPLTQMENPECDPLPLTQAPTHQLLSMHHTLFEEEEDEEHRRDRLAKRPGELIAAGECWRRRRRRTLTLHSVHMTTMSITATNSRLFNWHTSVMDSEEMTWNQAQLLDRNMTQWGKDNRVCVWQCWPEYCCRMSHSCLRMTVSSSTASNETSSDSTGCYSAGSNSYI